MSVSVSTKLEYSTRYDVQVEDGKLGIYCIRCEYGTGMCLLIMEEKELVCTVRWVLGWVREDLRRVLFDVNMLGRAMGTRKVVEYGQAAGYTVGAGPAPTVLTHAFPYPALQGKGMCELEWSRERTCTYDTVRLNSV